MDAGATSVRGAQHLTTIECQSVRAAFIAAVALIAIVSSGPIAQTTAPRQAFPTSPGDALPPWSPSTLDIHQIATGRGNSALTIFPDGTTMLVDAGTGHTCLSDGARPGLKPGTSEGIFGYARLPLKKTCSTSRHSAASTPDTTVT
jgi:hypothetical protein